MEKERSHVTERLLNLTLEIIYLLTGEDYTVVKKASGEDLVPVSHSREKRKINEKKILKVTSQILGVLAGEDWGNAEESAANMEDCGTQTPLGWGCDRNSSERCPRRPQEDEEMLRCAQGEDWSGNGPPPERCPRPPYPWGSTQFLYQDQDGDLGDIKIEYAAGEEDASGEQSPTYISQDGQYSQSAPEAPPSSPSPVKIEVGSSGQHFPEEGNIDPGLHAGLQGAGISDLGWLPEPAGLHKRQLTNRKNYPCAECGRCFTHMSNRIRHMKIHKGLKPFACAHCGKCFARKSHVSEHQRTHTGEKPFSCLLCGKFFKHKSHLVIHNRIHTGEKPFICLDCGKRFAQKINLLHHHQRAHAGRKT